MKGTSMRFRGKWSTSSEYENSQEYIDLTESDGSLWVCEKTNTGVKPVEGEYWALAAKGVSEESLSSINTQIEENRAEIVKVHNNLTWEMNWTVCTLENGWQHYAGYPLRMCVDPWGFVHIQGMIDGTSATHQIFLVLPPNYALNHNALGWDVTNRTVTAINATVGQYLFASAGKVILDLYLTYFPSY